MDKFTNDLECNVCNKKYKNIPGLFQHNEHIHSQMMKFCRLCKSSFDDLSDLTIHNLVVHDTSFIICGVRKCKLKFKTEEEHQAHLAEKAKNKKVKNNNKMSCDNCNGKFSTKEQLFLHKIELANHPADQVYICGQCDGYFENLEELMDHEKVTIDHKQFARPSTKPHIAFKPSSKKDISVCNWCDTKFERKRILNFIEHMKLDHTEILLGEKVKTHKCDVCNFKFRKQRELFSHKITKHKVTQVYICGQCDACFEHVEDLMAHEKRTSSTHVVHTIPTSHPHVEVQNFSGIDSLDCKVCYKKFSTSDVGSLIKHIKFHHEEILDVYPSIATNNVKTSEVKKIRWKCFECEMSFRSKTTFTNHTLGKHNILKEKDVQQIESLASGEDLLEIEIKLEQHDEDAKEYIDVKEEKLFEIIDMKTEDIYNDETTENTIEETLTVHGEYSKDNTDYNIKLEDTFEERDDYKFSNHTNQAETADYEIKVEDPSFKDTFSEKVPVEEPGNESRLKILVVGLIKGIKEHVILNHFRAFGKVTSVEIINKSHKKQDDSAYVTFKDDSSVVSVLATTHQVLDNRVACSRAGNIPGIVRVSLPTGLSQISGEVIKEFFETSYGKILDDERQSRLKKGKLKTSHLLTFEDDKASRLLLNQGHIIFDGFNLQITAYKKNTLKTLKLNQQAYSHTLSADALELLELKTARRLVVKPDSSVTSSKVAECNSCHKCKPPTNSKRKNSTDINCDKNTNPKKKKKKNSQKTPSHITTAQMTFPKMNTAHKNLAQMNPTQIEPLFQSSASKSLQNPSFAQQGYGYYQNKRFGYGYPSPIYPSPVQGLHPYQFGYNSWTEHQNTPYCFYDDIMLHW